MQKQLDDIMTSEMNKRGSLHANETLWTPKFEIHSFFWCQKSSAWAGELVPWAKVLASLKSSPAPIAPTL